MSKLLRNRDPGIYRLITIRTEEARLWMTPNREVRRTTGGIVARYKEICGLEIYAAKFLSNHYHILARAPKSNLDEFEENVNREVARRINWKNGRKGNFWGESYTDQEVVSEDDVLEAYLYINTNAVRHGLVSHPSLWPGFSTYQQSVTGKSERYYFHMYSAKPGEKEIYEYDFKLDPLPQFAEMPLKKRLKEQRRLIEERVQRIQEERREAGLGFLGVEGVQSQDPSSQPQTISRGTKGPVYSKDPNLIKQHKLYERRRREIYDEASMRYRLGDLTVVFPEYTFKPPLHRKPRLLPFKPLPDDYFKKVA